jgi:TatD DNase family protein
LGLALGIGGPATFLNARRLRGLLPQLRADWLILETDAPYLAPHPYRGQRNEPSYLPLVAESLGDLFGMTADEIAAQTTATAERCFTLE